MKQVVHAIGVYTLLQIAAVMAVGAQPAFTKALADSRGARNFARPTPNELASIEQLFVRTFQLAAHSEPMADGESDFDELVVQWSSHQMRLRRWNRFKLEDGRNAEIWVLRESGNRKEGRGFYAFLPACQHPLIAQAPHSFHDEHTKAIAERFFRSGQFSAASWNTVQRTVVDVTHARFHYMNSFTRAAHVANPAIHTIQLHGYSVIKRETPAGMSADIILSNGTEQPGMTVIELKQRLRSGLPSFNVLTYPIDVQELGATKNVQAQLLRLAGHKGFIHIELSRPVRLRLASDATVRTEFLKALVAACRR